MSRLESIWTEQGRLEAERVEMCSRVDTLVRSIRDCCTDQSWAGVGYSAMELNRAADTLEAIDRRLLIVGWLVDLCKSLDIQTDRLNAVEWKQ